MAAKVRLLSSSRFKMSGHGKKIPPLPPQKKDLLNILGCQAIPPYRGRLVFPLIRNPNPVTS